MIRCVSAIDARKRIFKFCLKAESYYSIFQKIDTVFHPLHILLTDTEKAGGCFMRRRRRGGDGILSLIVAFALGLVACWILPSRFIMGVLVVALLISCLYCNR